LSHLHKLIYRSEKQKHKQKPQLNHHPYRKLKKVSWLVEHYCKICTRSLNDVASRYQQSSEFWILYIVNNLIVSL
jgi:hypothetical protein